MTTTMEFAGCVNNCQTRLPASTGVLPYTPLPICMRCVFAVPGTEVPPKYVFLGGRESELRPHAVHRSASGSGLGYRSGMSDVCTVCADPALSLLRCRYYLLYRGNPEREGFEPSKGVSPYRISNAAPSTN